MEETAKMGRPSLYSEELIAEICRRLECGQTLTSICASNDMPGLRTVYTWLDEHEDFQQLYALSRKRQAETFAEQIIDIADESEYDFAEDENGKVLVNHEHINRARLRVDARKWHAAKTYPRKYSDKIQQEISGPDGGELQSRVILDTPLGDGDFEELHGVDSSSE